MATRVRVIAVTRSIHIAPTNDVRYEQILERDMLFYHHGVAIQPSVTKSGHAFVARVSILREDGQANSLGDLGYFANRQSAFAFAARCGTAFVDDQPMPKPPCKLRHA
jgi:hypothetical protein